MSERRATYLAMPAKHVPGRCAAPTHITIGLGLVIAVAILAPRVTLAAGMTQLDGSQLLGGIEPLWKSQF